MAFEAPLHSDQNEPSSIPIAAKVPEIFEEQGHLWLNQIGNIAQLCHTLAYCPILVQKCSKEQHMLPQDVEQSHTPFCYNLSFYYSIWLCASDLPF